MKVALFHPVHFRAFFHPGLFWGVGILVWLAQVALFVGLLVLVVMLLRRDRRHPGPAPRPPSLGILEERYARGEISREEFLERRSVLLGRPAATTAPPGPAEPTEPVPPPSSDS
jgi:putative membrane protein